MQAASPAAAFADTDPPLWDGLGGVTYKITTSSELAQSYFNQGLRLAYAFNHGEAQRAFRKAQKLDPDCAMCFWGEALVLGPNINLPMQEDAAAPALAAAEKELATSNGQKQLARQELDTVMQREETLARWQAQIDEAAQVRSVPIEELTAAATAVEQAVSAIAGTPGCAKAGPTRRTGTWSWPLAVAAASSSALLVIGTYIGSQPLWASGTQILRTYHHAARIHQRCCR